MTTIPSRAPAGTPTGGQFTSSVHEEPDVSLPNADPQADAMAYGAAQYADVLDAFRAEGWDASFTTTGGNCAAIELTLDDGAYVLVTDADDTLSWERDEHDGWSVGLYVPDENGDCDEPVSFETTDDGSPAKALELVRRALAGQL